jgi:hypothetical protein
MALAEEDLAERISRAISWGGKDGSWDDVVRRAARPSRRRRRAPRLGRTTLIAAVLVLLGGSLALAVGTRIVHALTGSPAPPAIKKQLAELPPAHPSGSLVGAPPWLRKLDTGSIVVSSARELVTLRTRHFGLVHLYAARTTKGGTCELVTHGRSSMFGCNPAVANSATPVLTGVSGTRGVPGANLIDGRATAPGARALRILFRHGSPRTVRLVEGYFLFELGPDHSRRSTNPPIAYDVLDAAGRRIATARDPLGVIALSRRRPPAQPVARSVLLLAHATLPNNGGIVHISRGRTADGIPCFKLDRIGPQSREAAWQCQADVGRVGHVVDNHAPAVAHRVPVSWQLAVENDWTRPTGYGFAYAYGWVGPSIARARLTFQDGAAVDLPLHDRYFLYVIPTPAWREGHRPSVITGLGADGDVLYRQFLYPRQHCIYPGRDGVCTNVRTETG